MIEKMKDHFESLSLGKTYSSRGSARDVVVMLLCCILRPLTHDPYVLRRVLRG